jgi:hypothetical protein
MRRPASFPVISTEWVASTRLREAPLQCGHLGASAMQSDRQQQELAEAIQELHNAASRTP